jgi:hypothetical protein
LTPMGSASQPKWTAGGSTRGDAAILRSSRLPAIRLAGVTDGVQ